MRDAEAVTFAGATLDRAAHFRSDVAALGGLRARPDARYLPFWRNKPLLRAEDGGARLGWLAPGAAILEAGDRAPIFLGLEDGAPRFAFRVAEWGEAEPGVTGFVDRERTPHPTLSPDHVFAELRAVMAELSPADAGNAAMARGLFAWHETHRFCARCGARSEIDEAGWRRSCPVCGATHFPRTDPVVIMLITHGNSVLLGRSPAWPEGMYSLLAGFMEPGESIEAAVRRETFEETGIRVGGVRYLASQPWPFPSSLMFGCQGEALNRDITLDPAEIEDARWMTREEVLAAISGALPEIRPARKGSIARFLIERWLADRLD
jgi:NAD+ diphosphatase